MTHDTTALAWAPSARLGGFQELHRRHVGAAGGTRAADPERERLASEASIAGVRALGCQAAIAEIGSNGTPRTQRVAGYGEDITEDIAEVWFLGRHRLICGGAIADPTVLERLLGQEKVDLVIGAPPLGVPEVDGAHGTIADVVRCVAPHAGPAAVAILCAPLRQLVALVRAGASCLVDPTRGRTLPRLPAVSMLIHARDTAARDLEEALTGCSPEAAIVLDPFAHTDAVLAAAEATGRSARLVCPDTGTAERIVAAWSAHHAGKRQRDV